MRAEALITETLKLEETRFRKTLERGLAPARRGDRRRSKKGDVFAGETAFTLYDTYGFPLDLTQDALRARGISVDLAGFDDAMERQQRQGARRLGGLRRGRDRDGLVRAAREASAPPSSSATRPRRAEGVVAALVKDGKEVDRAEGRRERRGGRSTRRRSTASPAARSATPARSRPRRRARSRVTDTQKKAGDLFVHLGKVEQGALKVGDARRSSRSITRAAPPSARNHSATHLLHEALRQVLGDHVAQKGSLVAPDRLRFDFSHPKPMTRRGARAGRGHGQRHRAQNSAGDHAADGARRRRRASGARALFGEKYGDEVRVVSMGDERGGNNARLVGRAVRRHACARAPATSA